MWGFGFIKKAWNWLFSKPSSVEKEALMNIRIMHKKFERMKDKKSSKAERFIKDIINKKGLVYCKEYSFKDLIGTIKPLRFDFAVIYKDRLTLIEYQGSQHYIYPNTFHKRKEDFDLQQNRDKQKKQYCEKHGIKLLEISYLQEKIIEEILNEHFP